MTPACVLLLVLLLYDLCFCVVTGVLVYDLCFCVVTRASVVHVKELTRGQKLYSHLVMRQKKNYSPTKVVSSSYVS